VTAELYEALKRRGTKIKHLPELCQSPLLFAAARVEVMGPCPNADLGRNANNQSIVLRLSLGRRAVLLAGDAEFLEEEELLVTHGSRLRADLLKIGHHGSRSSTSERWLSTVKPAMALISVGARNRFGHPHATTLERLTKAHVPVYRTDQLGAIQWRTDGEAITVTAAHVGWGLPGA
jgi:competence protein ComEC